MEELIYFKVEDALEGAKAADVLGMEWALRGTWKPDPGPTTERMDDQVREYTLVLAPSI